MVVSALVLACAGILAACGGEDGGAETVAPTSTATSAQVSPSASEAPSTRVALEGSVALDGLPLDAEFLGVNVRRDGLVVFCQDEIVAPVFGRYAVGVYGDDELAGCGAAGAELILWTYVGEQQVFSQETLPWPGSGGRAEFDATFLTQDPDGARGAATEIQGRVAHADGTPARVGAIIEARIGGALCGMTSVRDFSTPEEGHIGYGMAIVGPEAVPDCVPGTTITFTVDGEQVRETIVHDLGEGETGHEVDLTVE